MHDADGSCAVRSYVRSSQSFVLICMVLFSSSLFLSLSLLAVLTIAGTTAKLIGCRPQRSAVLQRMVSPVLPVQPQGRGMGQHRVGALGVARPDQLGGAGARHLPQHPVRQVRLLVGLGDDPGGRHAGDPVHGDRPGGHQLPGAGAGAPQGRVRPAAPRVGEAGGVQPGGDAGGRRHQRDAVPRPDDGVAARGALADAGGQRARRARDGAGVPEPGLQEVDQGQAPAALGGADGDVGVPRLLPGVRAGAAGRPRHLRARKEVRAQEQPGPHPLRLLHHRVVRRRQGPVLPRRPRRRLPPPPALRLRQLLRVQDVLRPRGAPPRAARVGQRVRQRHRRQGQGLGRHPCTYRVVRRRLYCCYAIYLSMYLSPRHD
ncbi:Beta-fructofuranosidase, cell wall isozyme [Zea mays]|uniref:Beta-fructofuranosidase, cell wall isozyme n=1 Tax=Zea mays TaxID=4577 RepID=A0A1D6H9Z0_MAIZE|nr:Beta-fructofuranosidase, cell wall isozyme [Zea mays]